MIDEHSSWTEWYGMLAVDVVRSTIEPVSKVGRNVSWAHRVQLLWHISLEKCSFEVIRLARKVCRLKLTLVRLFSGGTQPRLLGAYRECMVATCLARERWNTEVISQRLCCAPQLVWNKLTYGLVCTLSDGCVMSITKSRWLMAMCWVTISEESRWNRSRFEDDCRQSAGK